MFHRFNISVFLSQLEASMTHGSHASWAIYQSSLHESPAMGRPRGSCYWFLTLDSDSANTGKLGIRAAHSAPHSPLPAPRSPAPRWSPFSTLLAPIHSTPAPPLPVILTDHTGLNYVIYNWTWITFLTYKFWSSDHDGPLILYTLYSWIRLKPICEQKMYWHIAQNPKFGIGSRSAAEPAPQQPSPPCTSQWRHISKMDLHTAT